jgi:exoribonuclease R
MPNPPLRLVDDAPELLAGLDRIRADFDVPGEHSAAATEEARAAAQRVLLGLEGSIGVTRRDARDLRFVTIDPPGSRDLDQALHLERRRRGWRVHYAIADVPAFVRPDGALGAEVQERGVTYYLPDRRSPLHPPLLGEDAASLLPDQDRPAVLWTIDLDSDGSVVASELERAVVRSRAQLTYDEVQTEVDSGRASGTLELLPEVGEARLAAEAARDGVSLDLPTQRVVRGDGEYRLELEATVPAMAWNAQISLLTGIVAAGAMLEAGVGLLRTLPPPDKDVMAVVRRTAKALGVAWPEGASYASVVRGLDSDDPDQAALLALAARGLRGAGYLALGAGDPTPRDPDAIRHGAVASPYAHVTAPLRRLCDRATIEVCLALYAGQPVAPETRAELAALPSDMARALGRESAASRAAIDLVEALLLQPLVGQVLSATVVAARDDGSTVVIAHPAVQAMVAGHQLPLGDTVPVRVEAVDVEGRTVELAPG